MKLDWLSVTARIYLLLTKCGYKEVRLETVTCACIVHLAINGLYQWTNFVKSISVDNI